MLFIVSAFNGKDIPGNMEFTIAYTHYLVLPHHMVIALHCNIGVRVFGGFFPYREVSCVTIICSQDSRILAAVGEFRAGIPICDRSQ
jgi:hypothetical protein